MLAELDLVLVLDERLLNDGVSALVNLATPRFGLSEGEKFGGTLPFAISSSISFSSAVDTPSNPNSAAFKIFVSPKT